MYKIDSFVGVITKHEDSPDLAYLLEIGEHCKVELNGTVYYKIYLLRERCRLCGLHYLVKK